MKIREVSRMHPQLRWGQERSTSCAEVGSGGVRDWAAFPNVPGSQWAACGGQGVKLRLAGTMREMAGSWNLALERLGRLPTAPKPISPPQPWQMHLARLDNEAHFTYIVPHSKTWGQACCHPWDVLLHYSWYAIIAILSLLLFILLKKYSSIPIFELS